MPIQKYHPPLSDLIDAKALPGDLESVENFLNEGIDLILGKVFYKDYSVQVLRSGETKYYSIVLLTKAIRLPLFGEMSLVFFKGNESTLAEFPIIFEWSWPISKYFARFEAQGFSYAPEAFLDILIELSEIRNRKDFFNQIAGVFLNDGDDAYLDFFTDIVTEINNYDNGSSSVATEVNNIVSQLTIIKDQIELLLTSSSDFTFLSLIENHKNNSIIAPAVESINNSIVELEKSSNISIDIVEDALKTLIGGLSNLDEKFNRLLLLFRSWLKDIDRDDLNTLLIPQFAIELQSINMALEFPRKWLVPALESPASSGNYIEDPDITKLSALEFTVGNLKFSTKKGFEFENQSSFTFERAYIGKTGIMLAFSNLKVDMSKAYNIPEADADGRPEDFQGVYAESASVTLPAKWFKNQNGTNAEIYGKDLLIGTGGLSGEIGLNAIGGDNMFWASIGDNGFRVGFKHFDILFKQNKVLSSNIIGAMEIPKFVYPAGTLNGGGADISGQQVTIGIAGHIHDNGDFNLTASTEPPYPIELKDVFTYHIKSLELGKQGEDFYIGTSGKIEFQGFLKDTLKLKEIEVDRLRIYTDGTIEFEGGSIALVEPIVLSLGPVEITVSAIHYGSHQKEVNGVMRKFNYFGFDGGISVDPLGIEIRGDGVKFYYCSDDLANKPKSYLHIQTLYLDLTIPASTPVAIINGWLSIPEPGESKEYAGGIKLSLPQAKITGSADMKLMPKYPAFIIDASIELPAPIPLGPVGIFGFRGLIGYRYVAEKEAAGLVSGVDTWYDYYKKAPRGIHVTKFNGPDRTKVAGTPFSIGAGASLGTSADNGTILNIKAMVLLSIPSLFMIDGRAAILSARLGLDDTGDPPFFAFIAIGDNSLELGFGADFKMPSSSGDILSLYADIQAGFFFNDSSKWYINIGTKTNPITARVLTLLTITSYVMLSAKGIEAGARGEFNFYRKYGPIKIHAWAYIEVGGKISFEKPQFGAFMAAGVGADIDIKVVSLYASFDILFGVEAPKPFLIYGEFRYCVKIKILWVFKFKFCGKLSVSWEFNSNVDRTPINPMLNEGSDIPIESLVKGVNMLSNETFDLVYLASTPTSLPNSIRDNIIPLDTYIDIKSEKGLIPGNIASIIGGVNNPPKNYKENVPPEKIIKGKEVRQVTHEFSIESIVIKSWNPSANNWQNYHPYKALYPSDPTLDTLKIGQFQKSDGQYSTVRLLATTPFSYTEQGEPGWHIPEQYGITAGSLFCEGEKEVEKCATFLSKKLGQKYYCYDENHLFYSNNVTFFLYNKTDEEFGEIVSEPNPFGITKSLRFENSNTLQIRLPQPSLEVNLKLTSYSQGVKIRYYASLIDDSTSQIKYGNPDQSASDPTAPHEVFVSASALNSVVNYLHPSWLPITRIEVLPQYPNNQEIELLQEQIAAILHNNNLIELGIVKGEIKSVKRLKSRLERLIKLGCTLINLKEDPKPAFLIESSGKKVEEIKFAKRQEVKALAPAFCDLVKMCQLYEDLKDLESCFIVDKVSDWTRIMACAKQVRTKVLIFDKGHPECKIMELRIFNILLTAIDEFYNNPNYSTLGPLKEALATVLAYINDRANCEVSDPKKCDTGKLCDFYGHLVNIQLCFNKEKKEKACVSELQKLILEFDKENPGCEINAHARVLLSTIRHYLLDPNIKDLLTIEAELEALMNYVNSIGNCIGTPCVKDKVICAIWEQVFEIRNSCLPHPSQMKPKNVKIYMKCFREILALLKRLGMTDIFDLIHPKIKIMYTFLARPTIPLYTNAWEALQCVLDILVEVGNCDCKPDNKKCYTVLHQVCWMSMEAYQFNINIPSQAAIEADTQATIAGITQFIQPIWRPNTNYFVEFVLNDRVDNQTSTPYKFTYGFSTAGPVGFFHEHEKATYGDYIDGSGNTVEDANGIVRNSSGTIIPQSPELVPHPEKYALTSIRRYIDYKRSYPNADGNLLSAKPLFYDDETTRIDLYFAKAYATHFFHNWKTYNGKDAIDGQIKIVIKDPREGSTIVNPPYLDYDPADTIHTNIPQTVESWEDDPNPQMPNVFNQYASLFEDNDCIATGGDVIKPKSSYLTVVPKRLKPLKLYTALVYNLFDMNGNNSFSEQEKKEVHKFLFQTSRYKSFEEQVNSYILSDNHPLTPVTRDAVFEIAKDFTSAEVQAAFDTINGSANTMSDDLEVEYQHAFDRVVEGILRISPLDTAISTEFNVVKDTIQEEIIAIIIRNPEPFNNPKIPIAEITDTIQILDGTGVPDSAYKILFSKDYSQAIIMKTGLSIDPGLFDFKFQYKIWDGLNYVVPQPPTYLTTTGKIIINDIELT